MTDKYSIAPERTLYVIEVGGRTALVGLGGLGAKFALSETGKGLDEIATTGAKIQLTADQVGYMVTNAVNTVKNPIQGILGKPQAETIEPPKGEVFNNHYWQNHLDGVGTYILGGALLIGFGWGLLSATLRYHSSKRQVQQLNETVRQTEAMERQTSSLEKLVEIQQRLPGA